MKVSSKGKNEFERFDNAMTHMLSISKDEMNRRLAADPRGHMKPKSKKRKPAKASASSRASRPIGKT